MVWNSDFRCRGWCVQRGGPRAERSLRRMLARGNLNTRNYIAQCMGGVVEENGRVEPLASLSLSPLSLAFHSLPKLTAWRPAGGEVLAANACKRWLGPPELCMISSARPLHSCASEYKVQDSGFRVRGSEKCNTRRTSPPFKASNSTGVPRSQETAPPPRTTIRPSA